MDEAAFNKFSDEVLFVLTQDPYQDTKDSILKGIIPAVETGLISLDQADILLKRIHTIKVKPAAIIIEMD